ncbi:MAG TPA: hypothetical protein VN732_06355 [Solirubrobacterales bacterium]|nr:hypothetical protein [Solirubrobacterales bacterium]
MTERPLDTRPLDSELLEPQRNEQLRLVDWRFLLRRREPPRVIDLSPGRDSDALRLVSTPAGPAEADLVLAGFPTTPSLRLVRDALAPGGEVVCRWWAPRLAGPKRAKRRLRRAGFVDVRVYWPGPRPNRPPQFWLPLESREAVAHLLAKRPAKSAAGSGLRRLWSWAARFGYLAPVYVIARLPEGREEDIGGEHSPLLLTGGHRSINKVVGLEFEPGSLRPSAATKFARVEEAEAGLEREAAVLARLAEERPGVEGIPVLHERLRRWGRAGVAEGAIEGDSMLDRLTAKSFPEMARRVTDLLIELAGDREGAVGERTTLDEHLEFFEAHFGPALDETQLAALRSAVDAAAKLPVICEHRDCSPWNIVLAARDRPALLDWESAEPHGVPGLDLLYFLANAVFVLEKALEAGTTRAAYRRLLDPRTPYGAVAAAETARYCEALGLEPELIPALRRLCWMVHCRSDHEHLRLAAAGEPALEELRKAPFLGLLLEELEELDRAPA